MAHRNLGIARAHQGCRADAVAELREAIRLDPNDHQSHFSLAFALESLGRPEEAIFELLETIRLKPDEAEAHFNLGLALYHRGHYSDALAAYRESIRRKPDFARSHHNAAEILEMKGQLDEAIAELRTAIRLNPDYAEAHCNLAAELQTQGRYAESLAEYERGHELGSKRADWHYPSAQWIEHARRIVQAEHDLPALLRRTASPASTAERVDYAQVAHARGFPMTSARLWAEAFAAEPSLASDQRQRLRFAAARSAALAGCGLGRDRPPPDEAARSALRRHAHEWLQAELAAAAQTVKTGRSRANYAVCEMLDYWQVERDLAGIRDEDALANLPEGERSAWRAFWKNVSSLREQSQCSAATSSKADRK
jgi:tetratricopeptide (TPR) repeat protein